VFLAKVLARCVQTLMLLIYCGATAAPARFDTQLHPCIYEFTNVPFPIVTRLLLFFIYFLAADRLGGAACSSKQKVTRMNLRPLIAWRLTRCTNRDGDTALHAACKNGDALSLELLVKAGCGVQHVNK
jgi:hypothetical protein